MQKLLRWHNGERGDGRRLHNLPLASRHPTSHQEFHYYRQRCCIGQGKNVGYAIAILPT
jgi:hypothetical protein